MKNNYHNLVEEEQMAMPAGFYGMDKGNESKDFFLFITSLEDLELKGSNIRARKHFGTRIRKADTGFFKEIIHPKDYSLFLTHFRTCGRLESWQSRELPLRLRAGNGEWKEFIFKHRSYSGSGVEEGALVMSLATELKEILTSEEKGAMTNPKTETALTDSRNRYQLLLNSLDEAFCTIEMIFDLSGKPVDYLFLETNPAFEKHVSLINAEGKTMREMEPHHEEEWFQIYGNVAKTGKPERFEKKASNLGEAWFDLYTFPIGKEGHQKVAVLFSDITKRKTAENSLRELNDSLEQKVEQRTRELTENSKLLQTVFDTANQGVVVYRALYDKEGQVKDFLYLRVNKVINEQYQRNDLVGKLFTEMNPDAINLGIFDAFKETMRTGDPIQKELYYDQKGYNHWFRLTARRQDDLLISTLEDITKQKTEAQRLQESVRFKKQLTNTSPDIIMIFDVYQEQIKYLNRDIGPEKGMSKKEVLQISLPEIVPMIHPRERERAMNFHRKIMKATDEEVVEIDFRIKSGELKWEWYNALGRVFMRNRKDNVCEYMVLLRNIDEQKKTHKALIDAEKLSIKGEVARTLAHELRNPLASIGMAADILKSKLPENEAQDLENYVGIIKRSAKLLNNLVSDLLNSSNYSINLEKHCLAEILEKALNLADDRIYLSGIKVKKHYEGNYFVHADEEKLKIALLNIIVNASEAMDPNEGVLTLRIERKGPEFLLTIKDNGCGLEKEQREKLFDAFYTQKAYGVGVGLSSVKNILEEHDAKITVKSKPGNGTTFFLAFQSFE